MTHYWPIGKSEMIDVIGGADMTQGVLTTFTTDRFGNANSSLDLNGGFTQLPSGVYFNTPEFTISVWIYPINVSLSSRVIDFGNGQELDNIILTVSQNDWLKPTFEVYSGGTKIAQSVSSDQLQLEKWQFLTATFNESSVFLYINAIVKANTTFNHTSLDSSLNRINNYIGKSNWYGDGFSSFYLDDLRFYSKSLSQTEIKNVMDTI